MLKPDLLKIPQFGASTSRLHAIYEEGQGYAILRFREEAGGGVSIALIGEHFSPLELEMMCKYNIWGGILGSPPQIKA